MTPTDYHRQRQNPRPGDPFYLHLSDLRLGLERLADFDAGRLLDVGAGSGPYRSLFRAQAYVTADVDPAAVPDVVLDPEGPLPLESDSFDTVVSTQVIQYARDPGFFLRECVRVLKPGGALVLTTHGVFEEYANPPDRWRWTAAGLTCALEDAGVTVTDMLRLTTGGRAVAFLFDRQVDGLSLSTRKSRILRRLWRSHRVQLAARFHRWVDGRTTGCRVVAAPEQAPHRSFVGLGVRAEKPRGGVWPVPSGPNQPARRFL